MTKMHDWTEHMKNRASGPRPERTPGEKNPYLSVSQAEAKPKLTRGEVAERLNVPTDADDSTILAALDAKIAAKKAVAAPQNATDALYATAWPESDERPTAERPMPAADLYAKAWGSDRG